MTVGYLFSGVLGRLPLLAVLIAGFVLLSARRARLSPRSVLFARLGLGAILLGSVLQTAWTLLLPNLYSRLGYSPLRYGMLVSAPGLITTLVSAAGIGLLIAAVVTRSPDSAFAGPPHGGDPYAGPPPNGEPDAGQPFASGESFGAGDRPAGVPYAG